MRRSLVRVVLGLAVVAGSVAVEPVAADYTVPRGAIVWKVDHATKTITVSVKLQIYPACAECRGVSFQGIVNQFLADKIKAEIEQIWNRGYKYRCYKLIFTVDVKMGTDRSHIDDDRIAVGIEASPAGVRSNVITIRQSRKAKKAAWRSSDPADRNVAINHSDIPTTWSNAFEDTIEYNEGLPQRVWSYAHEFGHILGLDDAYENVVDPATGETVGAIPYPDAPRDLMLSQYYSTILQETINRLVERNRNELVDRNGKKVELSELRCEELVFESVILGPVVLAPIKSELHSQAQASVTLQGDESKGTLSGKAPLKYQTATIRPLILRDNRGRKLCEMSVNGQGETTFDVTQGSITRDGLGTPREVELVIVPGPTSEKHDAICRGYPNLRAGPFTWSGYFNMGHYREFGQKGLPIRGWTIVNSGGVIATKTLTSNCGGLCQQETTKLTLKEVK